MLMLFCPTFATFNFHSLGRIMWHTQSSTWPSHSLEMHSLDILFDKVSFVTDLTNFQQMVHSIANLKHSGFGLALGCIQRAQLAVGASWDPSSQSYTACFGLTITLRFASYIMHFCKLWNHSDTAKLHHIILISACIPASFGITVTLHFASLAAWILQPLESQLQCVLHRLQHGFLQPLESQLDGIVNLLSNSLGKA